MGSFGYECGNTMKNTRILTLIDPIECCHNGGKRFEWLSTNFVDVIAALFPEIKVARLSKTK